MHHLFYKADLRVLRLIWLLTLFSFNVSMGEVFEWPQFHGPKRDNVSRETGLLKQWPTGGPDLLWTAKGIGEGFSTVAIKNGLILTTGNISNGTVITALDLGGKVKWKAKNGSAYKRSKPGTRSTPTIDDGRVYHENADGDIVCLELGTGKEIWSLNILERSHGLYRNLCSLMATMLFVRRAERQLE